ncbi:Xylose transport system permease protein XylH [Usitatibacter rugosus]|uniref:Xylose transport system permease protein XylH n=1 Tax=Usitatibacter rugosus TaxID=2732067 RepID=A0A6M4GWD2_9PROT|nr:sugar ABC transporter permease [Usitatibacter rugosus]QJR11178.1 Xylose transport system permease protein XylH [Usitatibacter rugosus]
MQVTRFTALVMALSVIWIALAIATDGIFLTPRNLYNLSIQTCVTAIMACGMVYIIVARQIDLSVGSQMAFTGMLIAFVQVEWLGAETPFAWLLSIGVGVLGGMALGAFQGYWTAFRGVPAFVVTLAGYLMFRGAAFLVADGQTLAPLSMTYQRLGGGVHGSIGPWWSWLLGLVACAWVVAQVVYARRSRSRYNASMAPLWADALKAFISCAAVIAFVLVMNAYPDPGSGDGEATTGKGIGVPVLILVGVAVVLTLVSTRTRFGRYVFAYGGNPEAALLSGLPTKRVLLYLFILMGALAAISAVITTSRLNSGTHSIGQMAELYVIAAAVIGGTSFAGGVGTIPGAIVGALLIQSLDNGMVLMDVSSAKRQIAIGLVLIGAVWVDGIYQRRQAR